MSVLMSRTLFMAFMLRQRGSEAADIRRSNNLGLWVVWHMRCASWNLPFTFTRVRQFTWCWATLLMVTHPLDLPSLTADSAPIWQISWSLAWCLSQSWGHNWRICNSLQKSATKLQNQCPKLEIMCNPVIGFPQGSTHRRIVKLLEQSWQYYFTWRWGNFARQSTLARFFSAKNIPVISPWLLPMILQCRKFPTPIHWFWNNLLSFPYQGQITHSIPLYSRPIPLVGPRPTLE